MHRGRSGHPGRSRTAALMIGCGLGAAVFIEGCASVVHSVRATHELVRMPSSTAYDGHLGWVSAASISVPDAWGSGRAVHTTRRGFRGQAEVEDRVAAGRVRIFCSGGSFTFGVGVSDEAPWCARLGRLAERIEPVNLGVPGYGVGQSYLRYERDAERIEHHLHLFAFIGDALRRVGVPAQRGRGRPRLRVDEAGELTRPGGPAPYWMPALAHVAKDFSKRMRVLDLVQRVRDPLSERREGPREPSTQTLAPLLQRIFQSVVQSGEARGVRTVFIYLPVEADIEADQPWRTWSRTTLAGLGYSLVDLTDELRALPREDLLSIFIPEGAAAASHYTELGHRWAARALHTALRVQTPDLVFGGALP